MKKHKALGFGIFAILSGILLAGCNNHQVVSSNGSVHINENEQIEEKKDKIEQKNESAETSEIEQGEEATDNNEQSIKEIYEEKLTLAKEQADDLKAEDNSTNAMKAMEGRRWEIWDELLNEIYGDLKDMLSSDEMNALRTEQRKWLELRDKSALEASLKYEGGTMEHLEYVSVLANLTEQRCYELVEKYMQ